MSLYERTNSNEPNSWFRFKGAMTGNEANAYCAFEGGPGTTIGREDSNVRTGKLKYISQ